MRANLSIEDLGDLLDRALIAVLATLRTDGTVLLCPVYHEWRDGGFNIWAGQQNVKARHLRRAPPGDHLGGRVGRAAARGRGPGQARFCRGGRSRGRVVMADR
jgi:hypothetical protein